MAESQRKARIKRKSEEERIASKKESKKKYETSSHIIRITLNTFERWTNAKRSLNVRTNDEVASTFLGLWEKSRNKDKGSVEDLASTKQQTDKNSTEVAQHQSSDSSTSYSTSPNRDIVAERKAVCVNTELIKLANLRIKKICTQKFCNKIVSVTASYVGTSAQLNWVCSHNHQVYTWNSQPEINSTPAVDLLLASFLPSMLHPATYVTFRRIGLDIVSPPPSSHVKIEDLKTWEREESDSVCNSQSTGKSGKCQQYADFESIGVHGENGSNEVDVCSEQREMLDSSVEKMTADDMELSHTEIKIEVNNDESQMISEPDSASDEEFSDIVNYLSTTKTLKGPVDKDKNTQDNDIRSGRIKTKGYRPNYGAIIWEDSAESVKDAETQASDEMEHDEDENERNVEETDDVEETDEMERNSMKDDPDFNVSDETGESDSEGVSEDDTDVNDVVDDVNACDDDVRKENELFGLPATLKQTNSSQSESKEGPKRKRLRRSNKNKQGQAKDKKNETKKPWIKIHLAGHEDKYKIETVESFERKNRRIDASENLYSCLVCLHFKCSSKDAIEDHLEKHVNKILECENCHYIAYCGTDMREHRRSCSQTVKALFVCDICGSSICSYDSKKNHMGRFHGIAEWKCQYCPDLFLTRNERLDHMRNIHPGPCQYCESCRLSKHRLSKEEFQSHVENCSSKVQCQICGTLVGLNGMNKHIYDKHENVRKYQCPKCPYSAKSAKRLKTHLLSHENIHPYSCDQCSFTCIQPYQLTSHKRTHTGEKPYKCSQCKYAAAWNVQLKEHVKVHSMETAVTCEKCDIVFKNEKTLNMHAKKEQCML